MGYGLLFRNFFRPTEVFCKQVTLPAPLYNRYRLLLSRSQSVCVFVPIRTMQYQAVLTADEIIFIDNMGEYQVLNGEGGRLITIAWRFDTTASRDSLTKPVPVSTIYYKDGMDEVQRRLIGELDKAMTSIQDREKDQSEVTIE